MGKQYSRLVDSSKLMLDLNILSFRNKEAIIPFPTLIQTGTESFDLIRAASLGAPRLTIYSEASVNPQDLSSFPMHSQAMCIIILQNQECLPRRHIRSCSVFQKKSQKFSSMVRRCRHFATTGI